ncbi:coniferyl-alcohol dehydrogenase [Pseudomonas sp. BGr12]|uniref:coniferyl-alcohol dehydrogenase n=1 Tax=Pseudomonas sp. BGr12 TaxID=2936269 RepID=UPI00255957A2|nr:coniferyl-alcohol dehydrogenase [Pseudomonas sp. BJa5]MDL2428415.1 coniferyl-alcohol dehydrogenase [Pseudomonas sp. BJa5]
MSFSNKRVVVTGASSGVGNATAKMLLSAGAEVIGIDLRDTADCTTFIKCDLADPASIDQAVTAIKDPIHCLANVAGVPGSLPADLIFKVNYLGLRRLTELLLPKLEDKGAVVNVASTAGAGWRNRKDVSKKILATTGWDEGLDTFHDLALDAISTYDFTKELVILYTQFISSQERHRGVRVNSISPGAIQTPILKDFYDTMGDDLLSTLKRQAGGRDAYPAEIAGALVMLLRDDAFWVNGADLIVDGGAEVLINLEDMAIPPRQEIA